MLRQSAIIAAIVVIAGAGVVHGLRTERWGKAVEPGEWAGRLDRIPLTIGDWQGTELPPLSQDEVEAAQIAGYKSRYYVNRRTGAALNLMIVCGKPGPISIHPPDVCYRGKGFVPGPVSKFILPEEDGKTAEFSMAKFGKTNVAIPDYLRIFWAWSATGNWHAPDNPRFEYASYPALFKMYVIHQIARRDDDASKDPSADFMKLFLREIRPLLFPEPPGA